MEFSKKKRRYGIIMFFLRIREESLYIKIYIQTSLKLLQAPDPSPLMIIYDKITVYWRFLRIVRTLYLFGHFTHTGREFPSTIPSQSICHCQIPHGGNRELSNFIYPKHHPLSFYLSLSDSSLSDSSRGHFRACSLSSHLLGLSVGSLPTDGNLLYAFGGRISHDGIGRDFP
jgi:hypothetical protein